MSDAEHRTNSILVLGAGELGMAVLRALSQQRGPTSRPELTALLRPASAGEATRAADGQADTLRTLGIGILRADLAHPCDGQSLRPERQSACGQLEWDSASSIHPNVESFTHFDEI